MSMKFFQIVLKTAVQIPPYFRTIKSQKVNTITKLNKSIKDLHIKNEELSDEVSVLKASLIDKENINLNNKQEISKLLTKIEQFNDETETLKHEIEALNQKLLDKSKLQTVKDELEKKLLELKELLDKVTEEKNTVKQKLEICEEALQVELEQTNNNLLHQISKTEKLVLKNDYLSNSVNLLAKERKHSIKRKDSYKKQLQENNKILENTIKEVNNKDNTIMDLKKEIQKMQIEATVSKQEFMRMQMKKDDEINSVTNLLKINQENYENIQKDFENTNKKLGAFNT